MPVSLHIAPAGGGKTRFAVSEARRQAQGLSATPHVVVASALQANAFRQRLAAAGGAIGVRVLTFNELYRICLSTTDAVYSEISEPVQHRVIRSVVRQLPLVHYASLTDQPGFIHVLKDIIDQLKAAWVDPVAFAEVVKAHGDVARLRELADIYRVYQARLQAEAWADTAGLGWLAVEALESDASDIGKDWSVLLVDGFDDFSPVQLAALTHLAKRVARTVITLTGTVDQQRRSLAHRRFDRTRQDLVDVLDVEPTRLPDALWARTPSLHRLEAGLFDGDPPHVATESGSFGDGAVDLLEATDRAQEARAALRWLKTQIVERGVSPGHLALLARDITPYRAHVRQIADEFRLPIRMYSGQPLTRNPAVSAVTHLLRMMLPLESPATAEREIGASAELYDTEPALPPRLVVEAWRSPYFDWSAHCAASGTPHYGEGEPIAIGPGDADVLGTLARRGRVIAGLSDWEAAFEALQIDESRGSTQPPSAESASWRGSPGETAEARAADDGDDGPTTLNGRQVRELHRKFQRFVFRLRPPQGQRSAREFVRWLEVLIGPDPERASRRFPQPDTSTSLGVVARVRATGDDDGKPSPLAERDLAALRCLKKVLRGLVWAEEALDDPPITFPEFLQELLGAMEAAFYHMPAHPAREEILVADVVAARGVSLQALAVLGLAEGFFPAAQSEDPLLWDTDREELGLPLEPSTQSAEAEYFYETISAPSQRILLTRPRLADDGTPWEPSPFWDEIRRLIDVRPTTLSTTGSQSLDVAASWPELLRSASASARRGSLRSVDLWGWLRENSPASFDALDAAARILTWRQSAADSPFEGGLHGLANHFQRHFDVNYAWSASRLEAYCTCPFYFFISKVLGLEPREEPTAGIDWLQRGNLYHTILERVYLAVDDPTDLPQLLAALPAVARTVLDSAPERQGFRRTAWWAQTRREIVDDIRVSLEALSEEGFRGDFVPIRFEAPFGLWGAPALVVLDPAGEDAFKLRGLIDRVDRDAEGRVRIIDYKTGGPSSYRTSALRDGDKIQLPLYALAARDALGLGQPRSGFYWHVRHAEASPLTLEDFGPEEAIRAAVGHAWEAIRSARQGCFTPKAPKGGCPPYCPATGFCWHFERSWFDAAT